MPGASPEDHAARAAAITDLDASARRRATSSIGCAHSSSENTSTPIGEVHPISREGLAADVSIRYRGRLWQPKTGRQEVQQSQLYRYQDGRFELIEGGPSPVPEF